MSTTYRIPLTPEAQLFTISLNGKAYAMRLIWNSYANVWQLDISDSLTGIAILTSLLVVAGTDLLEQYSYLNFGGQLIAQTTNDLNVPPTYSNLGVTGELYFIVP
jgi:hypothetical protein